MRRILRAQGRLPEVRNSRGPQGFSRWDDANGEWIENSEDEGADGAHESNNADDMPGLVEMPELGSDDDRDMAQMLQLMRPSNRARTLQPMSIDVADACEHVPLN